MTSNAPQQKWKEYNRAILDQLDIQGEYALLGLQIAHNAQASPSGWLSCHAMGREDSHPSAAINVGTGPSRGRYIDHGGDHESYNLWEFAAKFHSAFNDWKDARDAYAGKCTGLKKPKVKFEEPSDSFAFSGPPTDAIAHIWASHRPGVDWQVLKAVGAKAAMYKKSYPEYLQQSVLVFPMYGPLSLEDSPTGYQASRVDGNPVLIYNKNSNTPKTVKVMSRGVPGVMGEHGLRLLKDASKVIWVEGVSDLCTCQSIVGLDETDWVVVSLGAAGYKMPSGLEAIMAGKHHFIVYDPDKAGKSGASMLASFLKSGAKTIRIVELSDGKDLRDHVQDGKDFEWLKSLMLETPVLGKEAEELKVTSSKVLLSKMKIEVLGRTLTNEIVAYSSYINSLVRIGDIDRLSWNKAAFYFGIDLMEKHVSDDKDFGKHEIDSEMISMSDLRRLIIREANGKIFDPSKRIGQGVWEAEDRKSLILVNGQQAYVMNGKPEVECYINPTFDGKVIDRTSEENRFFDEDLLNQKLQLAQDGLWRKEKVEKFLAVFRGYDNWERPEQPYLMAGCVLGSLVQSTWPIRPHIALRGRSGSGKSVLGRDFIAPLMGHLGFWTDRPTEAGVRQVIGTTSKVMILDEFDTVANQKSMLHMLRSATRGGLIVKGGRDGANWLSYNLWQMFICSGVTLDIHDQADQNRFIHLKLLPVATEKKYLYKFPTAEEMHEMRHELLAIMLTTYKYARDLFKDVVKMDFVESRAVEVYAVPACVLAVNLGWNLEQTQEFVTEALRPLREDYEESQWESNEESQLIGSIMCSMVRSRSGDNFVLEEVLDTGRIIDSNGRVITAREFEWTGVRKVTRHDRTEYFFFHPKTIAQNLLKAHQSDNMPTQIRKALQALPGFEAGAAILSGVTKTGWLVPVESVREAQRTYVKLVPEPEGPSGQQADQQHTVEDQFAALQTSEWSVDEEDDF